MEGVIGLQTFLIRFVAILEKKKAEQWWSVAHSCGWPNDALETLLQCSNERRTKTNTDSLKKEDSYLAEYWKYCHSSSFMTFPITNFCISEFSHHRQHTTGVDTKVQWEWKKGGKYYWRSFFKRILSSLCCSIENWMLGESLKSNWGRDVQNQPKNNLTSFLTKLFNIIERVKNIYFNIRTIF